MGSEYQALTSQSKKRRRDYHHPKGKHSHQKDNPRRSNKNLSKFICFTCDERGNFARDCPINKGSSHKKEDNKRRHHDHTAEDDKPSRKRVKEESEYSSSDEVYVFIYSLTGNVTHGSND